MSKEFPTPEVNITEADLNKAASDYNLRSDPAWRREEKRAEKDDAAGGDSSKVEIKLDVELPEDEAGREKLKKEMEVVMNPPKQESHIPMTRGQEIVYIEENVNFIDTWNRLKENPNPQSDKEKEHQKEDREDHERLKEEISRIDLILPPDSPYLKGMTREDFVKRLLELKGITPDKEKPDAQVQEKKETADYSTAASFDELYEKMRVAGKSEGEVNALRNYRTDFNKYHTGKEEITENSSLFYAFTREGGYRAKIYELLTKDVSKKGEPVPESAVPISETPVELEPMKGPIGIGEAIVRSKNDIDIEFDQPEKPLSKNPELAQKLEEFPKPAEVKSSAPEKPTVGGVELEKPEVGEAKEVAEKKLEGRNDKNRGEGQESWKDRLAEWTRYAKVRAGILSEDAQEIVGRLYEGSRVANTVDRLNALYDDRLAHKHEKKAATIKAKMDAQLKKAEDLKTALKYETNPRRVRYLEGLLKVRTEKADKEKERFEERDARRVEFEEKRNEYCNRIVERLNIRLEPYESKLTDLKDDKKALDDIINEIKAKITERENEKKELSNVMASLPFRARFSVKLRIYGMNSDIKKWENEIMKVRKKQVSVESKIGKADKKAQPIRESRKVAEEIMKRRKTAAKSKESIPAGAQGSESSKPQYYQKKKR